MKCLRPFLVAVLMIQVIATFATTNADFSTETSDLPTLDIDFNTIFFLGENEETLFIDFEALDNQLVTIRLSQGAKVLLSDHVSDLPLNAIYELNLDIIRPGDYVLELVTKDGIKIQKDIKVY